MRDPAAFKLLLFRLLKISITKIVKREFLYFLYITLIDLFIQQLFGIWNSVLPYLFHVYKVYNDYYILFDYTHRTLFTLFSVKLACAGL